MAIFFKTINGIDVYRETEEDKTHFMLKERFFVTVNDKKMYFKAEHFIGKDEKFEDISDILKGILDEELKLELEKAGLTK